MSTAPADTSQYVRPFLTRHRLFVGLPMPEWDGDALYALYVESQRRKLTDGETTLLCGYLAVLVEMRFSQKGWNRSLPEIGLDPQDVAAICLAQAHNKIVTGKIALRHDGPKVLLAVLGVMIWRTVASRARQQLSDRGTGRCPDVESHVWGRRSSGADEQVGVPHGIDGLFTAPADPPVAGVLDALMTPNATTRAIQGTAGPNGEGARATALLWRLMVRNLARDGVLWPHDWLPRAIRARTSTTQHALLAGRLQDFVAERAAFTPA